MGDAAGECADGEPDMFLPGAAGAVDGAGLLERVGVVSDPGPAGVGVVRETDDGL